MSEERGSQNWDGAARSEQHVGVAQVSPPGAGAEPAMAIAPSPGAAGDPPREREGNLKPVRAELVVRPPRSQEGPEAVARAAGEERGAGVRSPSPVGSDPAVTATRTDHMRILLLRRTRLQSRLSNALRGGVSGTREFGDLRGELDALSWVIDVAARHFQGCRR